MRPQHTVLQVLILVPEQDHPAYGNVRVMIKDSNDPSGDQSLVYLDSDGRIDSDSNRTDTRPASFVGGLREDCKRFYLRARRELESNLRPVEACEAIDLPAAPAVPQT